ncbi:MAG TPA: right-handed parallel beta-helix repeat-containing protein, partial [Candidatus Kapabacteria bacterium]|nr:right-handed parallel beta-helix repeat-containing protein [Candidatus Kapabacteria bacterium]
MKTHLLFLNFCILVVLGVLPASLFAQYPYVHYEHVHDVSFITDMNELQWVTGMATSNLGSFVIGRPHEKLRLLDNEGGPIAKSSFGITSTHGEKNIAVATNHLSQVAIVSVLEEGTAQQRTQLAVQILGNDPSLGQINMNSANIMSSTLPDYAKKFTFPNGPSSFVTISHLEAVMNDKYVYITWCQTGGVEGGCTCASSIPNATHYGYAVFDISLRDWRFQPALIPDPTRLGMLAEGISAPSVACNRWDESTDQCLIAFAYIDLVGFPTIRHRAATFNPFVSTTQCQGLVEPVNPQQNVLNECFWVRVVNYDEPNGISGYHFFYAWYFPLVNQPTINLCLFATDGTVAPGVNDIIDDKLPPPPPFDDDAYPMPGVGNGYTDRGAYLVYWTDHVKRASSSTPRPKQDLNICSQWGIVRPLNGAPLAPKKLYPIGSISDAFDGPKWVDDVIGFDHTFLDVTLGCNQTGILVTYTVTPLNGNYTHFTYQIRMDRPIAAHVRENTLLTNQVELTQPHWHQIQGLGNPFEINVLPSGTAETKADTLRFFNGTFHAFDATFISSARLNFVNSLPWPPYQWPSITLTAGSEAAANDGRRGYIIMDKDAAIDFNGHGAYFSSIGAVWNGGFEYNGTNFLNMDGNKLFLTGNFTTDTSEKFRALGYFNAPCTIVNSSLISNMGQIRFKEFQFADNGPDDRTTFNTAGESGLIAIDKSIVYMGNRNTTWSVPQIDLNSERLPDATHSIQIENSILSSGWEDLVLFDHQAAGYSSQIYLYAPTSVVFNNNFIKTTYVDINTPLGNVSFSNNKIYDIRNQLTLIWFGGTGFPDHYVGSITINDNYVKGNFPFGNGDWQSDATDFWIGGFIDKDPITGANQVEISRNTIWGNRQTTSHPFQANWTGIVLANGTNADVKNNTIYNIGTGIWQYGIESSTAFICSNNIGIIDDPCQTGIGIRQNAGKGVSVLNNIHKEKQGFYFEGNDKTTLISNNIHSNQYGAWFEHHTQTLLNGLHTSNNTYAGMNTFDNNEDNSVAQIQLHGDINQPQYPAPEIGKFITTGITESDWAQNKFLSTGNRVHISHTCQGCSADAHLDWSGSLALNEWDDGNGNGILTSTS